MSKLILVHELTVIKHVLRRCLFFCNEFNFTRNTKALLLPDTLNE